MSLVDFEESTRVARRRVYKAASVAVERHFAHQTTLDGTELSTVIRQIAEQNDVSESAVETAVFRLLEEDKISFR